MNVLINGNNMVLEDKGKNNPIKVGSLFIDMYNKLISFKIDNTDSFHVEGYADIVDENFDRLAEVYKRLEVSKYFNFEENYYEIERMLFLIKTAIADDILRNEKPYGKRTIIGFSDNEYGEIEPKSFSTIHVFYHNAFYNQYYIDSLEDLIALDFYYYFSNPENIKNTHICENCEKIFKSKRTTQRCCEKKCTNKLNYKINVKGYNIQQQREKESELLKQHFPNIYKEI